MGRDPVSRGAAPPGIAQRGLGRCGRREARLGRRTGRALGRVPCVGGGAGGVVGRVGGLRQDLGQAAGGADGGFQVASATELRGQFRTAIHCPLGSGRCLVKLGRALLGELGELDLVPGDDVVEGLQFALPRGQALRQRLKAGGVGFEPLRLRLGPAGSGGQRLGGRPQRGGQLVGRGGVRFYATLSEFSACLGEPLCEFAQAGLDGGYFPARPCPPRLQPGRRARWPRPPGHG